MKIQSLVKLIILLSLGPVPYISAQTYLSSNTPLWRISGKDMEKPSYLLGTIHIPQKKYIEFTDSVYRAILTTDAFYGELDFSQSFFEMTEDSSAIEFFKEKIAYLDSVKYTPQWKKMISQINQRYKASLDPEKIEDLVVFGQKLTGEIYAPEPGIEPPDILLSRFAADVGKQTGGLETFLFQMKMLYDVIDARLNDTTFTYDDDILVANRLKHYYLNQQMDSIAHLLNQTHPAYRRLIFDNRNKSMADSMETGMKKASSFFAVGCGHLPGDYGIIEILRKRGFELTPVHSSGKISMLLVNEILQQSKYKDGTMEETKIVPIEEDVPPPPEMPAEVIIEKSKKKKGD